MEPKPGEPSSTSEDLSIREGRDDAPGGDPQHPNHASDEQSANRSWHEQPRRRILFTWCLVRRRLWDSWKFDRNPSFFDFVGTLFALVGIGALWIQMEQTQSALTEARLSTDQAKRAADAAVESNRLSREQRAEEALDAFERGQREGRIVVAAEASASAARLGIENANLATLAQIERERDRLAQEQRPWLGIVAYAIQARPSQSAEWETREPTNGAEEFRVSMTESNSGRTPALKVAIQFSDGLLWKAGGTPDEWKFPPVTLAGGTVLFPGDDGRTQSSPIGKLGNAFEAYVTRTHNLSIWARITYCDGSGRIHWTQVGVVHEYGSGPRNFGIFSASVSSTESNTNKQCG